MSDSLNGDTSRTKFPFNYPLKINNSFTQSIAEDLGYEFPIPCKRCGKEFKRKYKEQIFCSRRCVSLYNKAMNNMEEEYGEAFDNWLNDTIDYSYSPEKF